MIRSTSQQNQLIKPQEATSKLNIILLFHTLYKRASFKLISMYCLYLLKTFKGSPLYSSKEVLVNSALLCCRSYANNKENLCVHA